MAGALGLGVHVVTRQLLPVAFISATKQRGSAIRCAANTPNKRYNIAVLPGDGVGNEVIPVAVDALRLAASLEGSFRSIRVDFFEFCKKTKDSCMYTGLDLRFEELPIGGVALDLVGVPLPEETLTKAKNSDAVLLGAVGWPKWDNNRKHLKPITALLQLRAGLEVFSNLRPITVFPQVSLTQTSCSSLSLT